MFPSHFSTLSMVDIFLLFIRHFFKHKVEEYPTRDSFCLRKSDLSRSEVGYAGYLLNGHRKTIKTR